MKELTIGLLWHSFNSGNLGVGALSLCNFNMINEEVNRLGLKARYLIIGNSGFLDYTPKELTSCDSEFIKFSYKDFLKSPIFIIKKIYSCDIVFDIGEGDSFSDIYGISRLLKLSLSKYISILGGNKLIFCPQTMGPFSSFLGRLIARYLMKKSYSVVTRDYISSEAISRFSIPNKSEAIDVAFLLPFEKQKDEYYNKKLRVGLNISGLLYHGGYNRSNQFGLACDYKEFTVSLIKRLLSNEKYEIHLVPHVVSENNPIEDDYAVSLEIKEQFPNLLLPEARFSSPILAKSYISNMDFFIGARMHSTIGAISSGVPVAPLAYSRKFSGLFNTIDYPYVLDMKEMNQESLISEIENMLANVEDISGTVTSSLQKVNEKINVYRKVISSSLSESDI